MVSTASPTTEDTLMASSSSTTPTTKDVPKNKNLTQRKGRKRRVSKNKKVVDKSALKGLVVGQLTKGDVVAIKPFGVFVRLNNKVDALLHKSQIGNDNVEDLSAIFTIGQTVEACITNIDYETGDVGISTRQKRPERFSIDEFRDMVGDRVVGKVKRVVSYGAFVDVGCKNIDALLHISRISDKKVEKVEDYLKVGDTIDARLHLVDVEKNMIQLSLRSFESDIYHDKKRQIREKWSKIAEDVASL